MAKRRMVKRNSSKKVNSQRILNNNSKKSVQNPFNSLNEILFSIRQMPITERGLLIAFLVFIGIVAFSTNGDMINQITGAFVQVTGEQVLEGEKIGTIINGVFDLITKGLLTPIFGLLSPTPNILFIKLLLGIILYIALSFAGLKNILGGKGNFIAGVIAFFGIALFPNSLIELYFVNLIPALLQFGIGLVVVLSFIIILHKIEVESRAGHVLKAVLYFLLFVLISGLDSLILTQTLGTGKFETITSLVSLVISAGLIYSIIMVIVEIARAFKGAPGAIGRNIGPAESGKNIGKMIGGLRNAPGKAKAGYRKGRWGDKRAQFAEAEKIAEKEVKQIKGDIASGNNANMAARKHFNDYVKDTKKLLDMTDGELKKIFIGVMRNENIPAKI